MKPADMLTLNEGKKLKFKLDLSSPKGLLKTLVAFANTDGGKIIIGVEDKTRRSVGFKSPLDEEKRLCNLVADSIRPRTEPDRTVGQRCLPYVSRGPRARPSGAGNS
jgi:ATP-dependent DNA helicase RecG